MSRQKAPLQSDTALCAIYISPDERCLLARIASRRSVGRDYLALRTDDGAAGGEHRPVPQWLGRVSPAPKTKESARPRAPRQSQHCRACVHLSVAAAAGQEDRRVCAAGVWVRPLLRQSLGNSRRLRAISATCRLYTPTRQEQRATLRRCRSCRHLAAADTVDARFVCALGVWANPMKPQSVANSRRLRQLGETCPRYAQRPCGEQPMQR